MFTQHVLKSWLQKPFLGWIVFFRTGTTIEMEKKKRRNTGRT